MTLGLCGSTMRPRPAIFRSLLIAAYNSPEPTLKRQLASSGMRKAIGYLANRDAIFCHAHYPFNVATPTFAEGGYQILRTAQKIITFDCGPLGYLATAAHGHADALSITLTAHGVPLLVDPGTYAYQEGGEWRQFLRSTAAHNTVVVDGRDQSEMQGTFLWGRKAIAKLIEWRTTPEFDLAIAEHDGYLPSGVTHRRTLLFGKPSCLFVIDELLGEGTHRFEQFWHFPAQAKVQQQERASLITVANQTMHIVPLFQREYPAQPTLYQGETTPIQGWVSAHYGHIAPAPVLGLRSEQPAPAKLVTALYLPPARPAPQKSSASIDFTVDAEKLEQQFEELQFCTYN
ncbi:MAG: heparinase II/III-family protein [Caldilineaceae bacterium]